MSSATLRTGEAATLVVSGGRLAGARNVEVGANFYDVMFVTGYCAPNFNGCNSKHSFVFSQEGAAKAAQALLDQVFVDGPRGPFFDTQPNRTVGCEYTLVLCRVVIPFMYDDVKRIVDFQAADNYRTIPDPVTIGSAPADEALPSSTIWAVFRPKVIVPPI